MKRAALLGFCAFLGLNTGAFAFDTVEQAYAAVDRAGQGLAAQAEDAMHGAEPDLVLALTGFAQIAAEARDAMDALEGPHDLRCIFNGMSEDAVRRAQQFKDAADDAARAQALEDIHFLAEDAVLVTPETEEDNLAVAGLPPMECSAATEPIDAAVLADLLAD